jgi:hypothetical protein
VAVWVKGIIREGFLCKLSFIGNESEIEWDGVCAERKETDVTNVAGMTPSNKQQHL